ncbi:hypothetical protein HKCCE2091_06195 [Rhodobacterales bacterium HKCCE2091]|nr:hypothetical protein [Rhodobacterales bacterium HKCCE2091]
MGTNTGRFAAILAMLAAPAWAQGDAVPTPRPAPDWLSDSIVARSSDIATSALPAPISAMPLGAVELDAVGLLPFSVTGLPPDLWGQSETGTLVRLFRAVPVDGLPAMLSFTRTLALAELVPPADSSASELFLARLDMLLARGALEPARALAERAGPTDPELFRRFFDASLLTGQAERACAAMRANPDMAPAFPARIFCLARTGDWPAAALSLGTGTALGHIAEDDADLIARFLDPELFEGEDPLPPDPSITPLFYEMRAAIGERPSSTDLPLAFAHSDLSDFAGWQSQIAAAERLIRSGAIEPQEWLAIATAHRPSASGAIWDRAGALQSFDAAMLANDARAVGRLLPDTVAMMDEAGLTVAFAALYGEQLMRLPLPASAEAAAHRIGLLSPAYERIALRATPGNRTEAFLFAIARGEAAEPPAGSRDPVTAAVAQAFAGMEPPARYADQIEGDRRGEALLRAALVLLSDAADSDDIADALRLFRALGLEDTARRAALQIMLLDGRAA